MAGGYPDAANSSAYPGQAPVATVISSSESGAAANSNQHTATVVHATTISSPQPVVVGQPVVTYAVVEGTNGVPGPPAIVEERYCGPVSCCIAGLLVCLFWPAALCVPFCPCDRRERVVYG